MALLEAMSCECACVSSATCLIPDIIEHGKDGYLCPVNKPEKFVQYIQLLMNDKEHAKEIGKNARKKIQQMFSLNNFVNNWNLVLRKTFNEYR
jgi:glycosyltransferase involved in cell wall biosynthesis